MADIVARIKLAYGERSYFDELSNTYLNIDNPVKDIIEGTNCKNLRRAVKARHINVIAGSLGTPKTFKEILMEAKAKRTGQDLETLMGDTPIHQEPKLVQVSGPTMIVDDDDNEGDEFSFLVTGEGAANTPGPPPPLFGMMSSQVVEPDPNNDPQNNTDEINNSSEINEEPKESLTAKPASIRSLKIGASRDIEFNYNVTAVVSGNEEITTAAIKSNTMKISVTGIAVGETELLVSTENGDITIPIIVVEA